MRQNNRSVAIIRAALAWGSGALETEGSNVVDQKTQATIQFPLSARSRKGLLRLGRMLGRRNFSSILRWNSGSAGLRTAMTGPPYPMHHVGKGGCDSYESKLEKHSGDFAQAIPASGRNDHGGFRCRSHELGGLESGFAFQPSARGIRLYGCVDRERGARVAIDEHTLGSDGAERRQPFETFPTNVGHACPGRRPGWLVYVRSRLRLPQELRFRFRAGLHLRTMGVGAGSHLCHYRGRGSASEGTTAESALCRDHHGRFLH